MQWLAGLPFIPKRSIAGLPPGLLLRFGWSLFAFGGMQGLRLVNNVVLAWLLTPAILGLAMLVFAVRTGVDLLSDVGTNQNIVKHPKGATRDFTDTAWSLQVIRGVLMFALTVLSAGLVADFFDEPQIAMLLPAVATLFLYSGFQSVSRGILQRELRVVRMDLYEFGVLALTVVTQLTLAYYTRSIWAIVFASFMTGAGYLIGSYLLIPGIRHRFFLRWKYVLDIFHFSKWIFLATAFYFLAWNFDRFYLAKQISMADLGLFAVARSYTDMFVTITSRITNMILFPTVAGMTGTDAQIRSKLLRGRRTILALAGVGLALLVALSDALIALLYDDRYLGVGTILPILLVGVWFATLASVNESILLGTSRPAHTALGNGAKFATLVVGLPFAFATFGFTAAILIIVASEVVRYLALWVTSRRQHLAFGRDDLALTILFGLAILVFRQLLEWTSLTGSLRDLFPIL